MKQEEYIKKWLNHSLSEAEQANFASSPTGHRLHRMQKHLEQLDVPEFNQERAWQDLQKKRFSSGEAVQTRSISLWNAVTAIAAMIVMGVSIYFLFFTHATTTLRTEAGEQITHRLPDGSLVVLNAASILSYKEQEWTENRQLKLQGEAYFEVEKGSDFGVQTEKGTVLVLGTRFTVNHRPDFFEVVCFEGKVGIRKGDGMVDVPTPGLYRLIGQKEFRMDMTSTNKPSWLFSESTFKSVPYREVIAEFERQYGVNIQVEGIDMETVFSGGFSHKNRDIALRAITEPLQATFSIETENEIVIRDGSM